MKIVINEPLVRRNKRIGQIVTFASLAVLAGGLVISFSYPDQIGLAYVALILGFLLSQVGIYFGTRWGRSPRPDELLTQGLKGLDDRHSLYHYTTPVSHLLITPAGLWILLPYHQKGRFTYENNRYRHKGGSFYMKIFGQESIGRPDVEASGQQKDLTVFLKKQFSEGEVPPIQSILVFTNEKAEVDLENAPQPGIPLKKLKEFIRKRGKEKPLTPEKMQILQSAFE